jgi:hypothetical protein
VQTDGPHHADDEHGGEEEETEMDPEPIDEEASSSPPPPFQPASKVVKTLPPVVPTKRSTSTRKTDNDIILINDPVPTAPAPPHATPRQIKPVIAAQTQQPVRSATKRSPRQQSKISDNSFLL